MSQRQNRPKPKPKPVREIKPVQPIERKFKETLTIEDLDKAGLGPMDLQDLSKSWSKIIAVLNALLISGPKITMKIGMKELNDLQGRVGKAFL